MLLVTPYKVVITCNRIKAFTKSTFYEAVVLFCKDVKPVKGCNASIRGNCKTFRVYVSKTMLRITQFQLRLRVLSMMFYITCCDELANSQNVGSLTAEYAYV